MTGLNKNDVELYDYFVEEGDTLKVKYVAADVKYYSDRNNKLTFENVPPTVDAVMKEMVIDTGKASP